MSKPMPRRLRRGTKPAASTPKTRSLRLLQETRHYLRDRGFNAFLAIDVGIPLEEMDAATQSIAFAQASNATVFIAPQVGDNLRSEERRVGKECRL